MVTQWLILALMLICILIASQLFTNALEHFGEKVGLSAGVTGSIFAAIATALPETTVPILAIVAGTSNKQVNEEISVGAILGAPLMLSTLALFSMAIFALKRRGIGGRLTPERTGLRRDLNFFLLSFFFAALAMYLPLHPVYIRASVSVMLIATYLIYLLLTCQASSHMVKSGHGVVTEEPLYFTKLGFKDSKKLMSAQLLFALTLLLIGAKGFINGVEEIAHILNVSVLLLSLLIIPIATELPEKVNSVLWIRQRKDTLAFGNVTGAMVFQGSLLPALGILMTPWQPSRDVEMGIIITFVAAAWVRLNTACDKGISTLALFMNGSLYILYLVLMLS